MSADYCRHRRPQWLLLTLLVIALSVIALSYGVIRGTAIGHADATRTADTAVSCQVAP